MTTTIGSTSSTSLSAPAPSSSGTSSAPANSTSPQSSSSLDAPAVITPQRDFAAEARQIFRNFQNAIRNGQNYQRFEPPTTTTTNAAGEEITTPVDPQEAARNAVRQFEQSQRNRERRAPDVISPAQRLLSVERQNVNVLAAERSAANVLRSLANTLIVAQSNASDFYNDFRASNGVRTTGGIGRTGSTFSRRA